MHKIVATYLVWISNIWGVNLGSERLAWLLEELMRKSKWFGCDNKAADVLSVVKTPSCTNYPLLFNPLLSFTRKKTTQHLLYWNSWFRSEPSKCCTRYNFHSFIIIIITAIGITAEKEEEKGEITLFSEGERKREKIQRGEGGGRRKKD